MNKSLLPQMLWDILLQYLLYNYWGIKVNKSYLSCYDKHCEAFKFLAHSLEATIWNIVNLLVLLSEYFDCISTHSLQLFWQSANFLFSKIL